MRRLAFLIPFRDDNGPRKEICQWVIDRINFFFPSASVFLGSSPDGEFNRSAAINDAFSQVEGQDIIVVNDADTTWNPSTILNGVHSLTYDGKFVIPYNKYYIMDKPSGERLMGLPPHIIIDNTEFDYDIVAEANEHVYHAPPVSGLVMMRTIDFEATEGFDERFVGWGEEDVAFVIKATGLFKKPIRLKENLYHIWHPKSSEYNQPHYKNNQRILRKIYL